jgi:hypothetical protein
MKKILIPSAVLTLLAILVVSGSIASTASAETTLLAEWLFNGAAVTGTKAIEVSGEVLLEDNKAPIVGKVDITCSAILDGWVDSNGLGLISEELTLEKVKVGGLGGIGLLCTAISGCEKATEASPIEDWPIGLPAPGLLFLKENGTFSLTANNAGTIIGGGEVLCLILGGVVEDTCSATIAEGRVENGTAPVGVLTPANSPASPNASCSLGGAGSGVAETVTEARIISTSGGELTVSSEGAGR